MLANSVKIISKTIKIDFPWQLKLKQVCNTILHNFNIK